MLRDFLAALGFFTRIPIPARASHDAAALQRAPRYWPLIGLIVGLVAAGVTELAARMLPVSLALLLGMVAAILVTGALHEDGLADSADGFGGGWDRARVLAIMKDSSIGSYGALALALTLLLRYNVLLEIDAAFEPPTLALVMIAGHAASRLAGLIPMALLPYARAEDDASARSRPLAAGLGGMALPFAALCGIAPCGLLPAADALTALVAAALTGLAATAYFRRRIDGYTGDCLGATQQLSEVAFYLGIACSFT